MRKHTISRIDRRFIALQQLLPCRSALFFLFACASCLPSNALLLPTRTTPTGTTLLRMNRSQRDEYSAAAEFHESRANQNPATHLTRQLFLSSVSCAFGVLANTPQVATAAIEPNTVGISANDNTFAIHPPNKFGSRVLSVTLRSLPVSGCWAAPVTVSQTLDSDDDSDFFTYLAVVDTGSPFLTAPTGAFPKTKDLAATKKQRKTKQSASITNIVVAESTNVSYEQYGTTVGSVEWRIAPYVTLIGNGEVDNIQGYLGSKTETEIETVIIQDQPDIVLGIPSKEVVEETGGIFLGLMTVDAVRPTPLQQLGYDAFVMQFRENSSPSTNYEKGWMPKTTDTTESENHARLILWKGKQNEDAVTNNERPLETTALIDRSDPHAMKLIDLTPYGPNLHHYAVLCDRFECRWDGDETIESLSFDCDLENGMNSCAPIRGSQPGKSLSRPVVVVFDTGLSGCIFSDTLWEEIQVERRRRSNGRRDGDGSKNGYDDKGLSGSNEEKEEVPPPVGCTVWLSTIVGNNETLSNMQPSTQSYSSPRPSVAKLSSISNYWRFQSFRLPWWYDEKEINEDVGAYKTRSSRFPHVIVLGSTFWRNPDVLELAIDTISERAKIITK